MSNAANTATNKPTKVHAGVYTLGAYGINKVEGVGWITCDIDDLYTGGGHDVFDTLAEAVDAINNHPSYQAKEDTMTYTQHAANEQAAADQWMLEHGAELDAEIQVGDDTGPSMYSARPESDKALMTDALTGQVRLREVLKATETTYKTSELPSDDLSGVDTESLGFYVVTTKQSEMAKRERSTFGIEFTRNVKGQKRGGKTGKTRETKAEKMARLANRYNK